MESTVAPVIDVTAATFQQEVVDRSRTTPVLIDFWATWCAPCKTLSPVLEKIAREMKGRFVLAKIDIDANPELADVFRIQSVPSVILLKEGRIADGFTGALPEVQVRKFLEQHLGAPALDAIAQATQLEGEGDRAGAAEILRAHLQQKPADAKARTMLARLLVAEGRLEEARKVFAKLAGAELETDDAKAIAARLDAALKLGDLSQLEAAVAADPKSVAAQLALGRALVATSQYDQGLEHLLQAAKLDVHHESDAPRKALIEVFNVLGQADPRTLEYQRRLMMILCV
jgi:putative thioredoxin